MSALKNKSVLVTGGAGFIGSNLVQHLVKLGCAKITVLDNLVTGSIKNIQDQINGNQIVFIEGDITDAETCLRVTQQTDIVLHQAALGSVPRSIQNPVNTHQVNVNGFLNMLEASRLNKVKRFIYASSSSVYGDDQSLPKTEEITGNPLSPYAVSKKTNELYAKVYAELYQMEIIGLRYFNVFGPGQNPEGPYAAVIPIFINNILNGKACAIFGDGSNRRDFTYVDNVVSANVLAATTDNKAAFNQVYNIAYGATKSVNSLFEQISKGLQSTALPDYLPPRVGEIKDSFANIDKAKKLLGYQPGINLDKGIELAIDWYKKYRSEHDRHH
jgi:UDP-N-acetylglucosamine/UDP-N-acetylgalactosamine 4-epimerase